MKDYLQGKERRRRKYAYGLWLSIDGMIVVAASEALAIDDDDGVDGIDDPRNVT